MAKRKTHEEFIRDFQEKGKQEEVEIIGKYINAITPIKCKCKKCGEEWETKPTNLISKNGAGCPYCNGKKIGKTNFVAYLRPDLVNFF